MKTVHGTTVAIEGIGILLCGPPGSGKSDMALQLIDRGAQLVADDRTILSLETDHVVARAPEAIHNKLEVRGIGIFHVEALPQIRLGLAVDLTGQKERLPTAETVEFLGISIPCMRLSAFEASAAAKIRLAVRAGPNDIER